MINSKNIMFTNQLKFSLKHTGASAKNENYLGNWGKKFLGSWREAKGLQFTTKIRKIHLHN